MKRSIGPSEHHFPSQAEDAWAWMLPRPPAAGRIGRAPQCYMGGCPLRRYQGMHAGREKRAGEARRARGPGGARRARGQEEAGTRGGRGEHPKITREREGGGGGGGIPRLQGALL